MTVPSAGETTNPIPAGMSRSGSRKKYTVKAASAHKITASTRNMTAMLPPSWRYPRYPNVNNKAIAINALKIP